MENTIIMENVLNPNKALEEYKSYLLTMYVKDYGEKYYDLIKNRMDNTIYLFDANPLENMKFLEENGEDIFPNIIDNIVVIPIKYTEYIKILFNKVPNVFAFLVSKENLKFVSICFCTALSINLLPILITKIIKITMTHIVINFFNRKSIVDKDIFIFPSLM